jgi:ACS family tartrate transporter-like MFS transporter
MIAAPPAKIDTRALTKVAWRLFPFLLLLYIVSFLDRINVSFAALQMNKDLGFSDSVFGFGAGIFFLGYSVFGVPSNILIERFGARRIISTIMVIWGCITVCMCLVHSATSFYVLRFLLGIAEAGFFPGMIYYLTLWFPKKEHGLAVARFMTAIPIAGVLGSLLASVALSANGFFGLAGWQLLFIASGIPAIILGIIAFFYLTDGPAQAKWLSDDERSVLVDLLAADSVKNQGAASGKLESFLQPIKSPYVWFFALLYFTMTLGMYGFQLWLPQIIHGFGNLSNSQTALLAAIPAILQAFGMNVVGRHSDKTGERRGHLAASALLAGFSLVLSGLSHNPWLGLTALCAASFGIWGTVGPFWAMPTSRLTRTEAAVGIGLINSVGNLGGFAGPYVVGLISTATHGKPNSFMYGLFAMALSLCMSAALAMLYKPGQSSPSLPESSST